MVPRINIEKIKEETWNNLERKSISHGEAVPVQARYQEGRDFLHPSSQTESRSPEEHSDGKRLEEWFCSGAQGRIVTFVNYLLLAAERTPNSTQKPDETP